MTNDGFDEKRGMVKKLLEMLKSHAANEVSTGLQKPDGEGDMRGLEVAHIEALPDHKMDEVTPEHDVREEENQPEGMHTGGIVDKVSPIVDPPMESAPGHPDKEGAAHGEVTKDPLRGTTEELEEPKDTEYSDAHEEPASMFASFLGRNKKKK